MFTLQLSYRAIQQASHPARQHAFPMSKSFKRILNLFITLASSVLIVLTVYSMLSNSTLDLTKLDLYEGKVIAKGIADNPAPNISVTKVFFFKLEGLDQTLATYNLRQDYVVLDSTFQVGDNVKVYFRRISYPDIPNLNIYQIEKNGAIVVGEGEIKNKELKGSILSVALVVLILAIGYLRDRKIRRALPYQRK
jgi:hypothetical protein